MTKRNYLIILCGLPASGKSSFAKKFKHIYERTKDAIQVKIVDPDKIRVRLYSGVFNYKKEFSVRKRNLKEIQKALRKGFIVISDNLNYYVSMRHELKEIAEKLNLNYYIIHVATPIEQCLIWNEQRGKPIPDQIIRNIFEKFDPFNYSWDNPIDEFDFSKIENLNLKVKNLIQIINQDISLTLNQLKIKKKQKAKNSYNEKLDQITRIVINSFLKNSNNISYKSQILHLRKIFIKQNLEKKLASSEIAKNFTLFLKKQLNIN